MFFEVLAIDEDAVMTKPYRERRALLEKLILPIPGRAELAEQHDINFKYADAKAALKLHFAKGVSQRWEGFVLKPMDAPYFSLELGSTSHVWIKLKKDYITAMGDVADFAVVGAGYCSRAAHELAQRLGVDTKLLKWTHFHIACLENKEEVDRFNKAPRFLIIDAINQCITKKDLLFLNQDGQKMCHDIDSNKEFDIFTSRTEGDLACKISVYFERPYVFEVLGSGFDKNTNRRYHSLRFPRILKIHWGRSWTSATSTAELEKLAKKALAVSDPDSQEDLKWISRLDPGVPLDEKTQTTFTTCRTEETCFNTVESTSLLTQRSPKRRRMEAPLLIRTDTSEMTVDKRTLGAAELNRGETGYPWPTPPDSSPLVPRGDQEQLDQCILFFSPDPAPLPGFITTHRPTLDSLHSTNFSALRAIIGRSMALSKTFQDDVPVLWKTCQEVLPNPSQPTKTCTPRMTSINPPRKSRSAGYVPQYNCYSSPAVPFEDNRTSEYASSDLAYDDVDNFRDARNTALMPLTDIVNNAGPLPLDSHCGLGKRKRRSSCASFR